MGRKITRRDRNESTPLQQGTGGGVTSGEEETKQKNMKANKRTEKWPGGKIAHPAPGLPSRLMVGKRFKAKVGQNWGG